MMWKSIASAVLLSLLTGCVTYYYPVPVSTYVSAENEQPADGHALNDPVYPYESISLASSAYYPWWSLDYFYLGHGYRHSGWSFGFSYGYPYYDYYYPYYGFPVYNFAWYAPYPHHYHHYNYYGWHQPYWHHRYRDYHYRRYGGHGSGHYAGYGNYHGGGHPGAADRHSQVLDPDYGRQRSRGSPTQDDGNLRRRSANQPDRSVQVATWPAYAESAPPTRVISRSRGYANVTATPAARRQTATPRDSARAQPDGGRGELPSARPSYSNRQKGTFSVVAAPHPPTDSSPGRSAGGSKPDPVRTQPVTGGSAWVTSMPPRPTRSAPAANSSPSVAYPAPRGQAAYPSRGYSAPSSGARPGAARSPATPGYGGPGRTSSPARSSSSSRYAGRSPGSGSRAATARSRGTSTGHSRRR